ncbi:cytochrome c1 heme lyase, putative [Plasmodium malariae]|uniref:Holocytochrome c-type synthase n=1 Tax=Plasmodium malariae TaxID=5858 RepID=A0A1A8WBN1_PLAMA|nr:cytochrome c1 heme lyase, putative [Plasmodium malariae]SBS89140.1 cytochrome c1 heme lyase [Plasmodium malariae]SBT71929.1 cytochrome c1 heme lyase, putative [Plasmodium malariae]SCP02492.1 cytochrome c1 heme lyase, putative [Plasmodium malariae]
MKEENNTEISNAKEKSSIPSNRGIWYYPSKNQFYNTTRRKGYSFSREELDVALKIHNAVNEETWKKIMKKEQKYFDICKEQKLIRFIGLPTKLSLKAFMLTLIGYSRPFDRHDWYIDRCGNTIKYIIDYYDGKSDNNAPVSIFIDVRPEFSYNNIIDHLKILYIKVCKFFFN